MTGKIKIRKNKMFNFGGIVGELEILSVKLFVELDVLSTLWRRPEVKKFKDVMKIMMTVDPL